ncbi:peptidase S41 [Erythrobacter sp. QSSC1-22B]|uniref:S41 family peptidase n=1 Tax=Erythrobacter sp. QSSC1-22B TaxID=1860125 RepID=UPI00080586B9|nr:S41 family peptidase [Erythrobacter sp. QSSC1-22B]OBX18030.1 peptidase S41 [Erythrobacter sp. QSSC1-22B]
MTIARTLLSATLAFSLAACGGGGSAPSAPTTGGGGGTPGTSGGGTASDPCSLANRQQFVREVLDEWYLFPELLAAGVNPASFTDVQSYIDALVAPARAQSKDRFFTYITSIREETALINSGSNAGFGIRLSYDTAANRVFVLESFENAPALPVGIDRGTELLSINGTAVASLMASGGPQAVIQALGPSDPGVSRTLGFRDVAGVERSATIAKSEFSLDPISDRYGVRILNDGTEQVGYINLRTFIVQDAGPQLRAAFQQFRTAGITRVILDLRYNGGGLVSVAELLGDLMSDGRQGQVFSKTILRPSKSAENEVDLFQAQPEAIAASRVAVIGRGGTASASELVTNSFIPYLGTNLALVGTNTFGKPVGQFAFDRSACDDRFRVTAFKTTNAADQGEYFTGLASVMPNTCAANDGILNQLGDPAEASVSVALDFLAGRSCTAIASGVERGVQSVGDRRVLLQPDRPTAAQREVPGLF